MRIRRHMILTKPDRARCNRILNSVLLPGTPSVRPPTKKKKKEIMPILVKQDRIIAFCAGCCLIRSGITGVCAYRFIRQAHHFRGIYGNEFTWRTAAPLTFDQQQALDKASLRRLAPAHIQQGIHLPIMRAARTHEHPRNKAFPEREQVLETSPKRRKVRLNSSPTAGCVSTAESQQLCGIG